MQLLNIKNVTLFQNRFSILYKKCSHQQSFDRQPLQIHAKSNGIRNKLLALASRNNKQKVRIRTIYIEWATEREREKPN